MASGLFDAYLRGEARAFLGPPPDDGDDRLRAVRRALRRLAPPVADALEAQNAPHAPSPAREANLASLRRGGAAVVTGQQVGLFLGPLYTVYKAASAVRVARALSAESGAPVVPIFWLQTEDHDLPEISACHVPGTHGTPLNLRLPADPDDRRSVAHRTLPDAVVGCLDELRAELLHQPHAEAHLARLARHYRPGAGWAQAFAGVLAELFADEGLVLIDPRDPALGQAAAPIHRHALLQAAPIAEALASRVRALEAAGFAATVRVRAGAPLSFFHPDGPAGPRYRLEPGAAPGTYAETGGSRTHARDALLAALDADPLVFSTSALLRPILQDSLLPTAAYVGGPAEVAYFAQLAPLYAAYDLPMPLIVPRARFRVVDPRAARLLAKLKLTPDDARRPEAELLATCRTDDPALPDPETVSRALLTPFESALAGLAPALTTAGPAVEQALGKTLGAVRKAVSRLEARYAKARLHRDEGLVADVRKLKLQLQPHDAPQERFYGMSYFAARYGEREFIDRVVAAVRPFDSTPRELP